MCVLREGGGVAMGGGVVKVTYFPCVLFALCQLRHLLYKKSEIHSPALLKLKFLSFHFLKVPFLVILDRVSLLFRKFPGFPS